jgi:flagellar hook-length control protein FliK
MKRLARIVVAISGLLPLACGESDEDKAKSQVCDARADIEKQVDTLTGLTITSASVDQIQESLKAIGDDLKDMTDAQGDLDPDRKQQVETATKTFGSQVATIGQQVLSGLSGSDAQAQVESAVDDLAASYKQALAPIDCG